MRTWSLIAVAFLALAGCASRDAQLRQHRLASERRQLEETLDRLEDRLIVNAGRVRFWQEMRERHESVSAIACATQERHADEMASHDVDPADPVESLRAARRAPRVARYVPKPAEPERVPSVAPTPASGPR